MKPDKLDIKIQDAAAQNEPAYNERAWSSMEKLLDKEMPQKKKEKKRILWIFLLLFLGTGALLLLNLSGKNTEEKIMQAKTNTASKATPPARGFRAGNNNDSTFGGVANSTIKNTNQNTNQLSQSPIHEITNQQSFPEESIQKSKARTIKNNRITGNTKAIIYSQNNTAENKTGIDNQIINPEKIGETDQSDNLQSDIDVIKKEITTVNKNVRIDENKKNDSLAKENNRDTSHKKNPTPKNRNKFINSFALNFSAGADVSAVNIDDIGKIKPVYGAGISYNINKRWTVRTGFYVEKKVYDTKAANYHPPARFWNYYPDLNYIDANCKVYEVPLIINYNFSQTSSHFWFVSAGISSYFMKKEKYYYSPKDPSVQYIYDSYTINNKNKHYFSSARLSAGYERKFSNTISIIAEPYINFPLAGVGYGKVKLYSTGILITLSIKPFAKK